MTERGGDVLGGREWGREGSGGYPLIQPPATLVSPAEVPDVEQNQSPLLTSVQTVDS